VQRPTLARGDEHAEGIAAGTMLLREPPLSETPSMTPWR